jgi:hypothetical protein
MSQINYLRVTTIRVLRRRAGVCTCCPSDKLTDVLDKSRSLIGRDLSTIHPQQGRPVRASHFSRRSVFGAVLSHGHLGPLPRIFVNVSMSSRVPGSSDLPWQVNSPTRGGTEINRTARNSSELATELRAAAEEMVAVGQPAQDRLFLVRVERVHLAPQCKDRLRA